MIYAKTNCVRIRELRAITQSNSVARIMQRPGEASLKHKLD